MKIATPLFLLVIIAGCRTNCHPVLEDEFLNNGNWLDDEFLDDTVSTSLLNPFDIGRFTPRLSPFLQPPTIDFEDIVVSFPGDDMLLSESEKYSKKPLPNAFVLQPPSRVMEPPTREFGTNPKKPTVGHLFIPGLFSLESLRSSFPEQQPSIESFWSPFSPDLPISAASIPADQQVSSASVSSEVTTDETDPKTVLEVTEEESKSDSETTQERKATSPKPEIDEPSRLLMPPTRAFQVEIPRSLVPPTKEFSDAGSN